MSKEIWRDVPHYNGFYQASNLGRIRSGNRILKQFRTKKYLHVALKTDKGKDTYFNARVARLIANIFVPNPHHFTQIEHKNGNVDDNRAINLKWHVPKKYIHHQKKLAKKQHKYKLLHKYPDEVWKPVPNVKGFIISNHGRVIHKSHNVNMVSKGRHYKLHMSWKFVKPWHGQVTMKPSNHTKRQCHIKTLLTQVFPKKIKNLQGEIWKDVPNFEDSYQISNMGRIKRKARVVHRRVQGDEYLPEVIKAPVNVKNHKYYASFSNSNGNHTCVKLALIVAKLFLPKPLSQSIKLLRHKNGNPADNRASNLKWANSVYKQRHINAIHKELLDKKQVLNQSKPGEVWKNIPNYKGRYQVSNFGRIRTLGRIVHRKNGTTYILHSKIMTSHKMKNGYCTVSLCKNHHFQPYYVHRIVARMFVSNPHHYPEINHKNEIRDDNRASNLEWCTAKYNDNYGHHNYRQHLIQSRVAGRKVRLIKDYKHHDFETEVMATKWIKKHTHIKMKLRSLYGRLNGICCNPKSKSTIAGYIIKPIQKKIS